MKPEKNLAKAIAKVNFLWDSEENFRKLMPEREMYCSHTFGDEEYCDCVVDSEVFNSIWLNGNPDWLSWELEIME